MTEKTTREKVHTGMTALKVLILGSALLLVVGLFTGWFEISADATSDDTTDKSSVTLTVNEKEIKDDAKKLKQKIVNAKETAVAVGDTTTVEGTITEINAAEKSIKLEASDKKVYTVTMNNGSDLHHESEDTSLSIDALQKDQKVQVVFLEDEKKDKNWIKELTIRPKKS